MTMNRRVTLPARPHETVARAPPTAVPRPTCPRPACLARRAKGRSAGRPPRSLGGGTAPPAKAGRHEGGAHDAAREATYEARAPRRPGSLAAARPLHHLRLQRAARRVLPAP